MAKTLDTTIVMGGKLDPSLTASVKAAEAMINKTATSAALAAQREQKIQSAAILKSAQLDQKSQLKAQQMAERAELKRQQALKQGLTKQERMAEQASLKDRQRAEMDALNAQQLAERTAAQRASIEQDASNKIASIREKEYQKMQSAAKKATDATAKEAEKRIKKVQDQLNKFGKAMTKYVTLPLIGLGTLAVKQYLEFDDAMRKVQATLNATPGDMERLTAAAKKMGRETRYTAVQAAGALEAIGQAGFNAAESINILPYALRAAQAFGMSIDDAAGYLTGSMHTFGIAPQYLERYTDQAAKAAATFKTNAQAMMDAGLRVGTVADYLKDGTVELFTMAGILSNANIEAEAAGTQLRTIISNLAAPADKGRKLIEGLGVAVTDGSGSLRSMSDIFLDINTRMNKLGKTDVERIDFFKQVFGDRAFASADALAKYAGSGIWETASAIIDNSEGTTQRMAETMEGGIGGTVRTMASAWEGALIEAGEIITPAAQTVIQGLADVLNAFSGMDDGTQTFIVAVAGAAAAIGPAALIVKNLMKLRTRLNTLKGTAETVGTGFAGMADSMGGWATAGKIFLAAAAVTAVGIGIKAASDAITWANLEERFGEIELSADQITAVANAIKTPFTDAIGEINAMFDALNANIANLKTTDLSLKTDLIALPTTVGTTEIEELAAKYNAYVDSIRTSLATYEGLHKVEIQTVFGDGDPNGTALSDKFSEYYGGLNEKAAEIGELLKNEFENALLSGQVDKGKVRQYQQQIAEVWTEIQAFETRSEMYALAEAASNGSLSYDSTTQLFQAVQEAAAQSLAGITDRQNKLIGNTRALYADDPAEGDKQVAAIRARMDAERAQLLAIQAEVIGQYLPDTISSAFKDADILGSALAGIDLDKFIADKFEMDRLLGVGDFEAAAALQAQINPIAEAIAAAFDGVSIDEGFFGFGGDVGPAKKTYEDIGGEEMLRQMTEAAQRYEQSNQAIPESITQVITALTGLKAIAEYGQGADAQANDALYGTRDLSGYLADVQPAVDSAMAGMKSDTSSLASVGGIAYSGMRSNMTSMVSTTALSMGRMESAISRFASQRIVVNVSGGSAPGFSSGGTVTRATLLWAGEGSDAETIVPHNDSARSKSLLAEAAAGVGMSLGGGGAQYVFAPNIVIQGNADEQQINDAMEIAFEQFKAMIDEYERERGRMDLGA